MVTISLKFGPSSIEGKEGRLYFNVTYRGKVKRVKTKFKVLSGEWDRRTGTVALVADEERNDYLRYVREQLKVEANRLRRIVVDCSVRGTSFTLDDIARLYEMQSNVETVDTFIRKYVDELRVLGKLRVAEIYMCALRRFMEYRRGYDMLFDDLTSEMVVRYEAYLKSRGLVMNTISFYMRAFRAMYNRAVEAGLTEQRYPFRHVYTGVDKTVKRALSLADIRKILALDLSRDTDLQYARDMFLFSFYTRGMAFVDMAFLSRKCLHNDVLTYTRRKTGQKLTMHWERCMQEIVCRYPVSPNSPYLLPVIKYIGKKERQQYKNASSSLNIHLKAIGKMAGLRIPLTMYVARHSWASLAHRHHIPLSVISKGMGHDSEKTTQIYLASLDNNVVDRANRKIISLLRK